MKQLQYEIINLNAKVCNAGFINSRSLEKRIINKD